ncbi:MAG: hypothetical protein IJX39_08730 [Clostridia bacterium]|nr:hypothetical protein [Clostridia bacterium]
MISNDTFCRHMADKLGITLFPDYGKFEAAFRVHNKVTTPTCGIFKMTPMTVTPIQGLFLASATATVDIAAEADNVGMVRAIIDGVAASSNGETLAMTDENGKTFMVTFSYSTAYVGTERTAPNQTGKMIPVSMTVYFSIIQNGVSSNDVELEIDGHPVFYTEFSANNQRVADSYSVADGTTRAAILQGARSFDFVSPLLSSELGKMYRDAVFGTEGNTAHCFTVKVDGETYAYIGVFGNSSASARAPQNVGCNISIMEGDPETLIFPNVWESQLGNGTVTLTAPATGARKIVFWGDGATTVWDTTDGVLGDCEHVYADEKTHTIRIFNDTTITAQNRAVTPDLTYSFYASEDNMTASLFTSDHIEGAGGYWRRNCTIDWGDGTTDDYNTMNSSADDLPFGRSHTYTEQGEYTIAIYNHDDPLWVSM